MASDGTVPRAREPTEYPAQARAPSKAKPSPGRAAASMPFAGPASTSATPAKAITARPTWRARSSSPGRQPDRSTSRSGQSPLTSCASATGAVRMAVTNRACSPKRPRIPKAWARRGTAARRPSRPVEAAQASPTAPPRVMQSAIRKNGGTGAVWMSRRTRGDQIRMAARPTAVARGRVTAPPPVPLGERTARKRRA